MNAHAARVVLVLTLLLAGVSGALAADDGAGFGADAFQTGDVEPDTVVLDVLLDENGTATWRVAYRVELTTENETAAFESLESDIQSDPEPFLGAFRDRMERTVRTAANATGREMAVDGLSVSTSTETLQGYGTVEYRFRWTNFATVDGETIRAGDALAGFPLGADSRLLIAWPEGYEATEFAFEPDSQRDRQAIWRGPLDFGPEGPAVTVNPETGPSLVFLGIAAVLGLVLATGALWFLNRDEDDDEEASESPPTESPAAASEPDEELLSNEERVLRLLEDRGGRVKQQAVASEFEWTDAKTSQVVGSLREDEKVEVFRLGRENVLVLPEESDL